MSLYANQIFIGAVELSTNPKEYSFTLRGVANNSVVSIRLHFDHQYVPEKLGLNKDVRKLSANFLEIKLE